MIVVKDVFEADTLYPRVTFQDSWTADLLCRFDIVANSYYFAPTDVLDITNQDTSFR